MGRSRYPSSVVMPPDAQGAETVLQFLSRRFDRIPEAEWRARMAAGTVHWQDGTPVQPDTPYRVEGRVFYYREVEQEPNIPFTETILYQDEELLVACKPHFLPVTPGGAYVEECLLNRLRSRTGIDTLSPVHRIDRETAGLVMFSVNPDSRGRYQRLFADGNIRKTYQAVAAVSHNPPQIDQRWHVENRMAQAEQWFRMQVVPGEVNARSTIRCLAVRDGRGLFELSPLTGKTHQLRVHMQSLGYPLENDLFYPVLQPKGADNYECPLQLLAWRLAFTDPLRGTAFEFESPRILQWPNIVTHTAGDKPAV